jgi:hypothetical protein
MATMLVIEDKPNKIVLEMDTSQPQFKPLTWRGCLGPAFGVTIFLIFFLALARFSLFDGSLSWLFWPIAAGAFLVVEAILVVAIVFSVSNYKNNVKEATVSIDLDSQQAVRAEKLNSGKIKQYDLKLEQVTRVLIHGDDLGHSLTVTLESKNNPSFNVNSDVFFDSKPMIELGKKLGDLINKRVVFKITDAGKPVSEETIQPST